MFFVPAELAGGDRKRSPLTLNGGPGYESGCQFHVWSRESDFLFFPDSARVFLVNKVLLHCRVADKMHSVCES